MTPIFPETTPRDFPTISDINILTPTIKSNAHLAMASMGVANVQDDVDLMMLDHLACVAIDKIIDAANTPSPGSELEDEVNWTITPVKCEF